MRRVSLALLVFAAGCAGVPRPVPHDASNARRAVKRIEIVLPNRVGIHLLAESFATTATYDGFVFNNDACAAQFGDHGAIDQSNEDAFATCIRALPGLERISWLPTADDDPLVAPTTPPTIQVWAGPGQERLDGQITRLAMRGTPVAAPVTATITPPPDPPRAEAPVDDTDHNGAPEEEIEFPAAEVRTRIRHGSLTVPGDPSKQAVLHVCFVGEGVTTATVRTSSGDAVWDGKAVEQAKHLEIKSYELHGGSYLACSKLTFTGKAP